MSSSQQPIDFNDISSTTRSVTDEDVASMTTASITAPSLTIPSVVPPPSTTDPITTSSVVTEAESNASLFDKSQSLVDIANNTFKELCKTLENEQAKLLELEERRKKLHDEMQRLKAEIEEEKHFYKLNIMESVSENLNCLNKGFDSQSNRSVANSGPEILDSDCAQRDSVQDFLIRQRSEMDRINQALDFERLDTCYEDEEDLTNTARGGGRNQFDSKAQVLEGHVQSVTDQLKNVLTECIIDQCLNIDVDGPSSELNIGE